MTTNRQRPDLPTVIAIALVAYALSNVLHEAVGHGGACVLLGGKPLVLSSVHFECGEEAMSDVSRRLVSAAGTIVNFIAGGLAVIGFKAARKEHTRYFLWLFATLNLLMGAGYFLFSGVGNIGDWAAVAKGTMSPAIWRPALAIFGGALYFLLARQSARWLATMVDANHARRLTVPAYFAGGLLYCISGLFNPVGPILIAISAAAASFGGASGLLWLTAFVRGEATQPVVLPRSYAWIVAGCIASLVFIAILGPSIHF
jgi:hypothetical protein